MLIQSPQTYTVFGTSPTSKKTLTASFVADSSAPAADGIVFFEGYNKLTLQLDFTTGSGTGEFCDVLVETSESLGVGAVPTDWHIFGETSAPDTSPPTLLQISGTPYKFPTDVATPAAATSYQRSYTIDGITSRFLRFSLKSTASSNFGSATLNVKISSN